MKMKRRFSNAYFIPVKPFPTAPGTSQGCQCVHRLRWRTFWAFFVKCDLMHSKNSAPIKLETCNVNVLCQLWVKYCIIHVFIVERNLAIKLKDRSFPDCLCAMFCLKNSWSLSKHSVYILYAVTIFRRSSREENSLTWSYPCIYFGVISWVYFSKIHKSRASGRSGE